MTDSHELREKVMEAIKKRRVAMRPRWHFILLSVLGASGALIVLVTLLYIVSLAFFFLHENGVWYTPGFGARGWFELVRSAPVTLIALVALFAVVLETLVRRYAFAYRQPLTMSLGAILLIVFVGGFAIAQTSLHHKIEREARRGHLPPPVGMMYGSALRMPPPSDVYHGKILIQTPTGFVMLDDNGNGTSTVLITAKTRLPYGEDFKTGDMVVVIGDAMATATIRAYGVRAIDDDTK